MAPEKLALVDAFDNAFILRRELSRMIGPDLPILMMTDSRALFDITTCSITVASGSKGLVRLFLR
jgi:hypothetical protein